MLCRVCLKQKEMHIDMFSTVGLQLNISQILHKHLWFLPEQKDISSCICNDCWLSVSSFHEFYVTVEMAHSKLMQENLCPEEKNANNDESCEEMLLKEFKSEPNEVECIQSDVQETQESSLSDPLFSETRHSRRIILRAKKQTSNQNATKVSRKAADEFELKERVLKDDSREMNIDSNEENESDIESGKNSPNLLLNESSCSSTKSTKIKTVILEPNCQIKKQTPTKAENSIKESSDNASEDDEEFQTDEDAPAYKNMTEEFEDVDVFIAKNIKMICEICQEKYPTIRKLKDHMEYEHCLKGYARCCGKKLFSRFYLLEHIERHKNSNFFKCNDCDKKFTERYGLRNHMMRQHGKHVEKMYNCDECGKRFSKHYLLLQHQTKHHKIPSTTSSICKITSTTSSICKISLPDTSSLKKHIDDKHRCAPYMCDICGKLLRGITAFETHQKEHLGVALPRVQCSKCGAWLKDKSNLRKHMSRHGDGKKYTCNICGKEMTSHPALLRHNLAVHAPPKHECCVCKKAFRKLLHLREHMTRHTGEVLYHCEFCPKSFNFNASFSVHRRKMHPKEYEAWVLKRREKAAQTVTIPQID